MHRMDAIVTAVTVAVVAAVLWGCWAFVDYIEGLPR